MASDASLGQQPTEDIQRVLRGTAQLTGALSEDEEALKGVVTNLGATAGALASQDQRAVGLDPRAARHAAGGAPGADRAGRHAAAAARAGHRGHPQRAPPGPGAGRRAALHAPAQRRWPGRTELRATARALRVNTPPLDRLLRTSVPLFGEGRAASACTEKVLVPFVNTDFPDPDFPGNSGTVNQKLMRSFVGLSGESRSVDANQSYFHASAVPPGLQVRPAPPDKPTNPPPHRPDVPCETQEPPEPGGAGREPGAERRPEPAQRADAKRVGGPSAGHPRRGWSSAPPASVDDWYEGILERRVQAS